MNKDKILECKDCGIEFIFTEGEQAFYQEKGFTEPRRCPECRKVMKRNRLEFNNRSRLQR